MTKPVFRRDENRPTSRSSEDLAEKELGTAHGEEPKAVKVTTPVGSLDNADAKTVECYTKAAEQGDADAQYHLGLYFRSRGKAQDYDKAIMWWTKAAEQGNPAAQDNLGVAYEKGKGVPKDYSKAIEWFTKAAEQGNAAGQNHLGTMFSKGRGVPKDVAKAIAWWTKAAEQRDAAGQNRLGEMYSRGDGVPQDCAKALELWTEAAKQGNAEAQHSLGVMYYRGRGVAQDVAKAVVWWTKAAEQGNAAARAYLLEEKEDQEFKRRAEQEKDTSAHSPAVGAKSHLQNGPSVEGKRTVLRVSRLRFSEAHALKLLPLYLAGFEIAHRWPGMHVLAFGVLAFVWLVAFSEGSLEFARWRAWLSSLVFSTVMFLSGFFFIEQWHVDWAGWGIFALTFVAVLAVHPGWKASIYQKEPKVGDVPTPASQAGADGIKTRKTNDPSEAAVPFAIALLIVVVGFTTFHITGMSDAVLSQRLRAYFGSEDARIALAWRYREGRGVPLDFSEAAIWFEKAANSGSAKAQYNLGILYYYGLGVPEQSATASNWLDRAARQDFAPAVSMLGLIAAHDQHDTGKAMQLWQRAVLLKDDWAEHLLGLAYLNLSSSTEDNQASEKNRTRALYWLEKARRDGVEPIGGLLQQVWMMVPDESVERVKAEVFRALDNSIAP